MPRIISVVKLSERRLENCGLFYAEIGKGPTYRINAIDGFNKKRRLTITANALQGIEKIKSFFLDELRRECNAVRGGDIREKQQDLFLV